VLPCAVPSRFSALRRTLANGKGPTEEGRLAPPAFPPYHRAMTDQPNNKTIADDFVEIRVILAAIIRDAGQIGSDHLVDLAKRADELVQQALNRATS